MNSTEVSSLAAHNITNQTTVIVDITICKTTLVRAAEQYLDDIIVYSKSFEQHMDALDKVYTALRDAGLKLNSSKYSFGVNRVTYLRHIISRDRS
jgi:hypothetical protein